MPKPLITTFGRVVVTGGAGFIGCALSQVLAPLASDYLAIDSLHPQVHPERVRPPALHPAAELLIADVTDAQTWDRALGGGAPDVVVHLAAETGTGQSLSESTRHATVNVVGTTQMLDAIFRGGRPPNHLLLTSSRAVYGEGRWRRDGGEIFYPGQRTHEQLARGDWDFAGAEPLPSDASVTVPHPTSVYGATKLAQEHILGAWCGAQGVPLSVLRLQNVYGPGQSLTNAYTGIVVLFAQLAREGISIPLYEDGRVTRDFVYIEDVVAALLAALGTPPPSVQHFDIGSGESTMISTLAAELATLYGAPPPRVTGEFRDGDVRHASCTVDRSRRALGWDPQSSLGEGLRRLCEWVDR